MLVLRDTVAGIPQGCAVALPGEFRSGPQRARFSPSDGHLYVSGSGGWGNYTPDDGCFERVRLSSTPFLPTSWQARDNGVLLSFPAPLDRALAGDPKKQFAQVWNYRYAADYGSPEFSVKHPGVPGHDALEIRSTHVLADGRSLFLEMPQLRPVGQLHLRLRAGGPRPLDLFATVHALGPAFSEFRGYQPIAKTATAAAPLAVATTATRENPWAGGEPGRALALEAALGLQFATKRLTARPGERLSLTFLNPDFVPHNFVLVKPGALASVGDQINRLIAQPGAAARHYVPDSPEVLVWSDMANPQQKATIHFNAPTAKGNYPYLCSFPGHWQVMNGVLSVE
jgi:azurin